MLSDSLPLFAYEGGRSPASRLDARFKLLVAVAVGAAVIAAGTLAQFVALGLLMLLFLAGSRVPPRTVFLSLRPVLLFVLLGGLVIVASTGGAGWTLGFAHLSRSGLELAGRLSAELLLLLCLTTILTFSTSPFSIAQALHDLLGFLRYVKVPIEDMTTMLTLAVTFMPIMSQEVDRYLTARAARGANSRRLGIWTMLGDMLVPLMQSNLQRGEELALALDTRLYGYGPRTRRLHAGKAVSVSVAVFVGTVAWIVGTLVFL